MHLVTQEPYAVNDGIARLASRIQSGDRTAESDLVHLYYQRIFVMALARTRNREVALDLTQDIVMAVLHALRKGQLRDPGRLNAFIYGTARNLVNNHFRSRKPEQLNEPFSEGITACSCTTDSVDQNEVVQLLLNRIDSVDRKILLMMLVEGYKAEEVGFRLNLSADAVRQRKSRAIKRIVEAAKRLSQKRQ